MRKFWWAGNVLILLCVVTLTASSQNTVGRWSLGIAGGANMWMNDFNTYKVSPGGDLTLRYGLHRYFSLGLLTGYDVLQASNTPPIRGFGPTYLRLNAIPVAAVGYFHFAPRKTFNPYIFIGAEGYIYKRSQGGGVGAPDDKFRISYLIPAGFGFDTPIAKDVAFKMEVGYRNFGDWLDMRKNKSPDGYATARLGLTFIFGDSDADDDDADALTNGQERRFGTDPKNPDSDGDGLKDGEEARRYRTNPLRPDTDGDGLNDGDEVVKYRTDPTRVDSDGDGLSDGDEVLKYKTEPLKIDTDGDGLEDGEEVMKYKTSPVKVDTDADGLSDWDEARTFHTEPLKADTDGDGLTDGEEVRKYKTDPLKADTDGGSIPDGVEIGRGTNPLDPRDDVPQVTISLERGRSMVLDGVNFASGSATLLPQSLATLEKAYAALAAKPAARVEIAGYTDNVGIVAANERLSRSRAESVKSWLVKRGISPSRLTTAGKGPANPIAPNSTEQGRAKNRRIEFHVK